MLEDQVAYLLQKYLGNYVRGLNKEALKISVWKGDVELTNMQLKPEALNALKLPVRVKAGFLGSVKLKVPWSRLGQDPVIVHLDRIFLLAEPATSVEGCSEDAVQEAKRNRVREMEMKLLERSRQLKSEMNKSWLGSLINTIIGNLKLSISNIHIRYEDLESNTGHPFAAGVTLERLSAVTIDDSGRETFVTGGSLDRIQKSVELNQLAIYMDSDISPWHIDKPWEDMLPDEWVQVFRFGTKDGKLASHPVREHTYVLQPVTGNARYLKSHESELSASREPLQKATVNLDDVTLCLSKNGYRDILKLADNFASFNERLKYAHYRPVVSVTSDPRLWWKYAYRVVSEQIKKASGKLSWEQVLRHATLRKKYISLYASLLKSDMGLEVVDDNEEIKELDRGLDIELILQWRMLSHKFLEQSTEPQNNLKKQKSKKSWWSFGWGSQAVKDESESFHFSDEDWEQLNRILGYKEDDDQQLVISNQRPDVLQTLLEIHVKRNASKLLDEAEARLAELSSEGLDCSVKLYPETKVVDMKLESYQLSCPTGLLAESATSSDSLVAVFRYKPFDAKVDWSLVAKASPCYATYLKDSIDGIIKFFESNTVVSQTIALETAAAVQMTIDGVKRSAQQQVNRALKDHSRFSIDLDIAAPKITIPTEFQPDDKNSTKLMLDLGNLVIRSKDDHTRESEEEMDIYLQFDMVLSDVSALLVDGDYAWKQTTVSSVSVHTSRVNIFPVIDKCGVILKVQQIRSENPSFPSTRLSIRLPSLGFYFSPARYHRLMQVVKIFQEEESESSDVLRPWDQADFEGWLSVLTRKGMGNREAVWKRRYVCLVGPFIYVLESPGSKSYRNCLSLRGKQIYQVPSELVGEVESVLALCDAARMNNKNVIEDVNALILHCETDDSRRVWKSRLQRAIYHASVSAPVAALSETSSDDSETELSDSRTAIELSGLETLFLTGFLDELNVNFSYNHQGNQGFTEVLLGEESPLFQFRAIGGQVELLIKGSDMFIGTVLKSLEIEDLVCRNDEPCYLARSFIRSADAKPSLDDARNQSLEKNHLPSSESDENFYEASENLVDFVDTPAGSPHNISEFFISQKNVSFRTPSFHRIDGLLPVDHPVKEKEVIELSGALDSFVRAQIVIYDQNSPLYSNTDMQVSVTLATLSFFCRRPTVLAVMEFVNAINIDIGSCESFSEDSSADDLEHISSREQIVDDQRLTTDEYRVKGFLGKGKSRIIFNLTLDMTHAEILLMTENETKLASLSQENLVTDIKVFPSSFSIKASLGNLRISDESLPNNHMYFWICDMRDPEGTSFVELLFSSFSADEEDYEGYEYSLSGQLSEVRFVYLNRFVQEIVGYFMGLVPNDPKNIVKYKDQLTNSEKWFTTDEFEGSPALKLDLSLKKPIILMPRSTDSEDYLKLDVVHITVQNTFKWLCGNKNDMNAVRLEIMTVQVEDINLNVGIGSDIGESIIQDVEGVSVVIQRSLRDLMHQLPSIETTVKVEKLKAALSNKEYQVVTECALSNISETPNVLPSLSKNFASSSVDAVESVTHVQAVDTTGDTWIVMKVSVVIDLAELCLYSGPVRDVSLATVQASGAWLLYKSNTLEEGTLSASLKGFSVIDDREGTKDEFRLAIGTSEKINRGSLYFTPQNEAQLTDQTESKDSDAKPFPTMLILDARFGKSSTSVSVCIQRPQLLVALDFLLAVVEFFVPTVSNLLLDKESKSLHIMDGIILDRPIYHQPAVEISLSPLRPLIVDDEKYDHFIYDGNGGILDLRDRRGAALSAPSTEPIIYVESGKRLQFKNVIIKNGHHLDSSISLGTNSSYSASEDDGVFLEGSDEGQSSDSGGSANGLQSQINKSADFIINFQAVSPELTFYSTSKEIGESPILSNRLLHAQLDAFGRLVLNDDTIEVTAKALGLTMESNGVQILEPFDTSVKYTNASGKTNISLSVSDIFMNFSFSILRLFLLVEEEILAFLRRKSKETTVVCLEFDRVGMIRSPNSDQVYTFWRPLAPSGFAVLGDYLTPMDKPPSKGVLAINTQYIRVKRPKSFKLIWSPVAGGGSPDETEAYSESSSDTSQSGDSYFSVWFPVAPEGYVALGCVVSPGKEQPLPSCTFCVMSSFVSHCPLRDCVTISCTNIYSSTMAFWRVNNSLGTFLPSDPATLSLLAAPYELRLVKFGFSSSRASGYSDVKAAAPGHAEILQPDRSAAVNSSRFYGVVASFRLIWWNRGSNARKRLSIWRPEVPEGMVYFGDIAVNGYEPPNTCVVLRETADEELFRVPADFQLVGQIKKQRGMENISFWQPEAPPGFVSLGCIACKGSPKQYNFGSLRCIRSDMVSGDQFLEASVWDTTDTKVAIDQFSIWTVGNELGTFVVRGGFRKPPRRFALRLSNLDLHSGSDDMVVDAEIRTLSVALFDDYGGLVVPLFNLSMSGIGFSLHGRTDYLNSAVSFSLAARSYNDKYESWEPLIEPVDAFIRYQYDPSTPGAGSQLRFTTTRDLNLNVSVSNANMVFQAYSSWNNLSHINEYPKRQEISSPFDGARSAVDVHQKRSYHLMPQNKLGQDIFIRATEMRGLSSVVRMPSGDVKPINVPVSLNMLDSHLNAELLKKFRAMVTVIIVGAEFPRLEGLASHQYTVHMRLSSDHSPGSELLLDQQSVRTCGRFPDGRISCQTTELINWNEIFFFKIHSAEQYKIEFILSDMGKGDAIGYFLAPIDQIAKDVNDDSGHDYVDSLMWINLLPGEPLNTTQDKKACGRLRVAVLVSSRYTVGQTDDSPGGRKSGFIQISPSIRGPWTPVRLNYGAPAACWRLGNDVVASEVSIKEGNRYVTIRSLVSVRNNTEFVLELRLAPKVYHQKIKTPADASTIDGSNVEDNKIQMDEVFETEKYEPTIGWINFSTQQHSKLHGSGDIHQDLEAIQLPSGWEWIDDWYLDTSLVHAADGWVYAPNIEGLNWPASNDSLKFVNHARQRRWIRHRKLASKDAKEEILVGQLKPGEVMPLPLSGLSQPGLYVLQLRPTSLDMDDGYSWSTVVKSDWSHDSRNPSNNPEICVSALTESEEMLYCSLTSGTSLNSSCGKIWFCVSIQATEIAKDVNSNSIQDWSIVVKSPLSITNYLPFKAEYSIFEMRESRHFAVCSRGIISTEKAVKFYNADIRKPLFLSLVPQWRWLPVHEAVLISHPHEAPSKTMSLKSSVTGRIVQLILDQNYNTEKVVLAKSIRIYAPYWFSVARCPPLKYKLQELTGKMPAKRIGIPFRSKRTTEVNNEEINDDEIYNGLTIASALNFKLLGLSVSISGSENDQFGPVKELSPLGDMDGSIDVDAYDGDGRFLRLFISAKPCSYQSVPTKVITVRPYMTFTNRIGQDILIKLNSGGEPKVLHAYDARISFISSDGGADKLQVRLVDTEWSFPVQIVKEDTVVLVLRRPNGTNLFLRTEIRGYEEGSRFTVVFRPESTDGPIRIENHTTGRTISIRQSGFSENAWTSLQPLSTTNFSWEDPYGQKCMDVRVDGDSGVGVWKLDFESAETCPMWNEFLGMQFHVIEIGHIKVARFTDERKGALTLHNGYGRLAHTEKSQSNATSFEVIIELGVVGVSVVDHRPKELSYVYLERVFVSYSTGYDGGNTSRFKLIMGYLQIDNQLPLSLMPVLLAPEENGDVLHPVFKMTVTVRNESIDGVLLYPYIYIRVTDRCWRLNIHEPIIWAIVEFYGNLQLDRIPKSSSVTQVDPEIRFNLVDVSEVRLKVSLETAPAQRPRGVLGVWSPIISAIGNAFKIQVHLRRVMHRDRFMRQSSIVPAIGNRIWRDLIHNPLHLLFSVDVLGMTSSTLSSLSKGFAELSTDGQFLQLRSKQVSSRRITGVGDGIIQGTEAFAQGVAFGVSGVVRQPVESARQHGFLGLAQGFGRAFVGFIVQPVSGALDFFSLTVDGIGASCSRCLEVLSDTTVTQRIRNPRAIRADGVLTDYFEKDAVGQMVLHLAEASRRFGCTEIFKEPSKFALSDYYEEHFVVPHQRLVLVTNKRVMLLQCSSLDKMDRKPSKIMWDVPWEELMSLELAKAGFQFPSHLILHLKNFRRSENFVRVIKCNVEVDEREPQALKICSVVRKMWKAYLSNMRSILLKVPASQRYVSFSWADSSEPASPRKTIIKSREPSSSGSAVEGGKFVKHSVNFRKIWSSERELKSRCALCKRQASQNDGICSIWRPICPDGYVSIGDIARIGSHPPNVAAVYRNDEKLFALPVGYDLVWRNCSDDYKIPVSIWYPRGPEGFASLGCVAVAGFTEPEVGLIYCIADSIAEETVFEEQKIWSAPDSYPWGCHIYQVRSDALHFVALRQRKEETEWKPIRVLDDRQPLLQLSGS